MTGRPNGFFVVVLIVDDNQSDALVSNLDDPSLSFAAYEILSCDTKQKGVDSYIYFFSLLLLLLLELERDISQHPKKKCYKRTCIARDIDHSAAFQLLNKGMEETSCRDRNPSVRL